MRCKVVENAVSGSGSTDLVVLNFSGSYSLAADFDLRKCVLFSDGFVDPSTFPLKVGKVLRLSLGARENGIYTLYDGYGCALSRHSIWRGIRNKEI